ncbi:protein DBF4 homolog B [Phyllobates terribilis]|uniref:protein DBF4 homolog B n=1 Tax=Phyllobates terribilis TaxID=111132 RepID=UPI003CCAB4BB
MSMRSPVPSGRHVERGLTLDRRKRISFTGKSFYLDLPHNKQTQLLTKAICSLSGVIESFLSRDVNYVVTGNRKAAHVANGESNDRKEGTFQHPTTEKIEKTPYSRGKQLLKKVVQSQLSLRVKRPAEGKGPAGAKQTVKVGKLKSPFLKIEDQSRKYRPIYRSFSKFPECSFISSDRGPFETVHTNHSAHKDRDVGEQDKDVGERPQNCEKSGYCECCHITYRKLCEHLISKQHCVFALNASNYRVIDDITSRIVCDFVTLPFGFKPSEQQCEDKAPPQSLEEEPPLTKEEGLDKEFKNGESKDQLMDQKVQMLIEELRLASPEEQYVKQDAECSPEAKETLSQDPPVENMVVDSVQEHLGDVPENVFIEDHEPQSTVSTMNAEVQCDLPLLMTQGAEEMSPMGLVTKLSWYMEEAGLTSLYTVQSVVIPPAQVIDENPDLTTENVLLPPPFDALGDPVHALAQGGFNPSSNDPVQEDPIITARIDPQMFNVAPSQANALLTDAPSQHNALLTDAPSQHNALLTDAPSQHNALLTDAPSQHNALLTDAPSQHNALLTDAPSQHNALLTDAPSQHNALLTDAPSQHNALLTDAPSQHNALLTDAPSQHNALLTDAPSQHNALLTDTSQVTPSAMAFVGPSPAPATGRDCTLHLGTAEQCPVADASGTEVPLVEAATDQHQHLLLVSTQDKLLINAPCELQSELSSNFCIDQFTLAPWHPAANGNATVTPGTETLDGTQDPELLVPNTDWCGGKRKHCWSPCHPPAKRHPLHCLPMPMWVFHQLPSDCVDRDRRNKAAEAGEGSPTTLCFNPKLAQYEASSESDWDSQLVSQHYNNPQQTAHLGDLRTAQVSLDESWYGKRLGSVLTHEQALGSPSTTQTITVTHASYDLYLSGVAS